MYPLFVPDGDETPPHFHDILIEDVVGTDVYTDYFFRGLPEAPISQVELRRVKFYDSGATTACEEVDGFCRGAWPCPPCFRDLGDEPSHRHSQSLTPRYSAIASDGIDVKEMKVIDDY